MQDNYLFLLMVRGNLAVAILLMFTSANAAEWDYRGSVELESKSYFEDVAYPAQDNSGQSVSFSIKPEVSYELENDNRFLFKGLFRYDDTDENRTHNDLRELNYLHLTDDFEITIGLSHVFWGVTESRHLVDIINQTDFVEDISGEEKLGQPMLNVKYIQDWGTLSGFVLFGFREREYANVEGRLSGPLKVDTDNAVFESTDAENHIDYALRWSNTIDDWEVGLSVFKGTSREPRLLTGINNGQTVLQPYYDQINQLGLDLQYTGETILWKLESISRKGNGDEFFAAVGGFEYTFYSLFESTIDLGLIVEYLYDDRDILLSPATNLDDDIAIGARLAWNDEQDTQLLMVVVVDQNHHTSFINIEAERRMTDSWKVAIQGVFFTNVDAVDPLSFVKNDDHISINLSFHF